MGVIGAVTQSVTQLQFRVLTFADADTVHTLHLDHLFRSKGCVRTAANGKRTACFLHPFAHFTHLRNSRGTHGKTDNICVFLANTLFELLFFRSIGQMIKGRLITMLFEHSGNNGNSFMVVAFHIFSFFISEKIGVYKQKFERLFLFRHEPHHPNMINKFSHKHLVILYHSRAQVATSQTAFYRINYRFHGNRSNIPCRTHLRPLQARKRVSTFSWTGW